uniref:DUF4136 domain-containing protein n=1 Tax=Solibacter usitatus (strain Ellin6076) TaxID=234267 RepID=Q01NB4_SOLUE
MHTFFKRALPVAGICALIAFASEVRTDYDHKASFEKYRTYSWIQAKASDSLWENRIMEAVDSQLAARGWTKAASGGDASVAAVGTTRNEPTFTTFYEGMPGWGWRGFGTTTATTSVDYNHVGTLVVDVFDSNTKALIWRGVASDTLSSKPDKNDKKLDEAVQKMFEHFPPKSKG